MFWKWHACDIDMYFVYFIEMTGGDWVAKWNWKMNGGQWRRNRVGQWQWPTNFFTVWAWPTNFFNCEPGPPTFGITFFCIVFLITTDLIIDFIQDWPTHFLSVAAGILDVDEYIRRSAEPSYGPIFVIIFW